MASSPELKADEVTVRFSILRVGRVYGVEGATVSVAVIGPDGQPVRPELVKHVGLGTPGKPITVDVGPVLVDERLKVGEDAPPPAKKWQSPGPEVPLLDVENEEPPQEKNRGQYPA